MLGWYIGYWFCWISNYKERILLVFLIWKETRDKPSNICSILKILGATVWLVLPFYWMFKNASSYFISKQMRYLGKRLSYLIWIIFQKPYRSYFQKQKCFNRGIKFSISFWSNSKQHPLGSVFVFDLILLLSNENIHKNISKSKIVFLYIKAISLWNIKTAFEGNNPQIWKLSAIICFPIYKLDMQRLWTNSFEFQMNL